MPTLAVRRARSVAEGADKEEGESEGATFLETTTTPPEGGGGGPAEALNDDGDDDDDDDDGTVLLENGL